MLIFGHEWIESPRFVKVFSVADIGKTRPEDILLLEPLNVSLELARHCRDNDLTFAVTVNSIRDAIFVNAIGADFIVSEHELAITIQKIADDYLFDSKVLVLIEDEKKIDNMVRFTIDGVIFPRAIVQP
ncbi:hypothetical protein [Nitratifractor sp.]